MRYLHLDRATLYAMAFRSLAIVTGPITVVIVAASFTPGLQGYYFTFAAILTMQTLLELGLGTALQQIASHEWAHLELAPDGRITGNSTARDRLATVTRFALRWYRAAGVIAMAGFVVGGYAFFAAAPDADALPWKAPWIVLSFVAGLSLFLSPGWSILEGCNQVTEVYGFRLLQGIATRLVLWISVLAGAGLWALALERGGGLVFTALFFVLRYRRFFRELLGRRKALRGFWRLEILPLQWRFALVWIAGYLPSLFIPVIFAYQGPVEAGRFGMTWAIAAALMSVSHAIVTTRMPRFAMFVARKEYRELDSLFRKSLESSLLVLVSGTALFLGALLVLEHLQLSLKDRFLPLLPTAILLAAILLQQVRHAFATYLRAHKREPYVVVSVVETVSMAIVLFPLGKLWGVIGLALGFLVVNGLILIPSAEIFRNCRLRWRQSPDVSGR